MANDSQFYLPGPEQNSGLAIQNQHQSDSWFDTFMGRLAQVNNIVSPYINKKSDPPGLNPATGSKTPPAEVKTSAPNQFKLPTWAYFVGGGLLLALVYFVARKG